MSRRRTKTAQDEQRAWLERRDKEREEAARKAQEQLSRAPVPAGFRRLRIEDL